MAMWDAAAKGLGLPLHRVLNERFRPGQPSAESVWVYAAGGYYRPGDDVAGLRDEIQGYLDLGYKDVKIKIGGAPLKVDLERIEAVIDLLPDGSRLAVDANGRFDVRTAMEYAAALEAYHLLWYEEPCDPLDYRGHAVLAEQYPGVLATGENLFSVQDVGNLVRYGGLRPDRDILQMDPCLSYGVSEYVAMLDRLAFHGWASQRCCPHGGHQYNLALAAAFSLGGCESYPKVFEPYGGFADDTPVTEGRVALSDVPGVGIERKEALHALFREQFR